MKRCPVCAELLADGLTTCPYCGEILETNATPTNDSPTPPPPTPNVGMTQCPICGESIPAGLTTCPICGEAIEKPIPQETPSPVPPVKEAEPISKPRGGSGEMRTCPVCGEQVSSDLTTCPYCSEPINFSPEDSSSPNLGSGLAKAATVAAAATATNVAASNLTPPPPPEPIIDEVPSYTPEPTPPSPPEPTPPSPPEPTPQYTPEPTPQYTPEPTPQYTPEPTPQYTPEPAPQYKPEPTPQYTLEPAPQYKPEPTPQYTPEPTPQSYGTSGAYQANAPQTNEPPYVPPVAPQKSGSGMKWFLIALIALLALALGGLLYYFLSKDSDDDSKEGNPTRTETTVSSEKDVDDTQTVEGSSDNIDESGSPATEEVTVVEEPAGVTSTQTQTTNTPPVATPQSSARPDRGYDGSYDDVASGRNRPGGRHDRRPSRDDVAPDGYGRPSPPPHRGRDRGNSDVAPPNPGGTGFHLEPQGGRSGAQQCNNGPGFKLQQVDRIPNE